MKKFDVVIALEGLREAREKWGKARAEFFSGYEAMLTRLVHEGAANYMSDRDIAKALGVSPSTVRKKMRAIGLDSRSKTLLSQKAAEALANNSLLLGIGPHEMDLMSPLAYLPMGEQMKRELRANAVSQVTDVPVEGYADTAHAIHDLHLRGGRLRYVCPLCGREPEVSGNDPVYEVAYLLWQFDKGYITQEDRDVNPENWMLQDPSTLHPDDAESIPGWLDAARSVIAAVSGNDSVIEALSNIADDIENYCDFGSDHENQHQCTCRTATKIVRNHIAALEDGRVSGNDFNLGDWIAANKWMDDRTSEHVVSVADLLSAMGFCYVCGESLPCLTCGHGL